MTSNDRPITFPSALEFERFAPVEKVIFRTTQYSSAEILSSTYCVNGRIVSMKSDRVKSGTKRLMSSILCKKQRGDLLAFRIIVKENRIENPFHTVSVPEDTHGPCPSLHFPKRSLYKIGGADLAPQ